MGVSMVEKNYITVNHELLMTKRQLDSAWQTVSNSVVAVQKLPEGLCLKGALCWALLMGLLYRSHLPIMAGPTVDIRNITATMTTLTPAAFYLSSFVSLSV